MFETVDKLTEHQMENDTDEENAHKKTHTHNNGRKHSARKGKEPAKR